LGFVISGCSMDVAIVLLHFLFLMIKSAIIAITTIALKDINLLAELI